MLHLSHLREKKFMLQDFQNLSDAHRARLVRIGASVGDAASRLASEYFADIRNFSDILCAHGVSNTSILHLEVLLSLSIPQPRRRAVLQALRRRVYAKSVESIGQVLSYARQREEMKIDLDPLKLVSFLEQNRQDAAASGLDVEHLIGSIMETILFRRNLRDLSDDVEHWDQIEGAISEILLDVELAAYQVLGVRNGLQSRLGFTGLVSDIGNNVDYSTQSKPLEDDLAAMVYNDRYGEQSLVCFTNLAYMFCAR